MTNGWLAIVISLSGLLSTACGRERETTVVASTDARQLAGEAAPGYLQLTGGAPATTGQFPSVLSLCGCTGTRIKSKNPAHAKILTAGHCVIGRAAGDELCFMLGVNTATSTVLKTTIIAVDSHPLYTSQLSQPDIAVITVPASSLAGVAVSTLRPTAPVIGERVIKMGYGYEGEWGWQAGVDDPFGAARLKYKSVTIVPPLKDYSLFTLRLSALDSGLGVAADIASNGPGDSGGGLFDPKGEVIGVNSQKGANHDEHVRVDRDAKDGIYQWLLSTGIAEKSPPSVSLNKGVYSANEEMTISHADGSCGTTDWLAVAVKGSTSYLYYVYTTATSGQKTMAAPSAPGDYELRYYKCNGYEVMVSQSFSVPQAQSPASLSPNKSSYAPGETIYITHAGGTCDTTDWIAISSPSAPLHSYFSYNYTTATTGQRTLTAPVTAGAYELRYFSCNGYELRARQVINVGGGSTGQISEMTITIPHSNWYFVSDVEVLSASGAVLSRSLVPWAAGSSVTMSSMPPGYLGFNTSYGCAISALNDTSNTTGCWNSAAAAANSIFLKFASPVAVDRVRVWFHYTGSYGDPRTASIQLSSERGPLVPISQFNGGGQPGYREFDLQ